MMVMIVACELPMRKIKQVKALAILVASNSKLRGDDLYINADLESLRRRRRSSIGMKVLGKLASWLDRIGEIRCYKANGEEK